MGGDTTGGYLIWDLRIKKGRIQYLQQRDEGAKDDHRTERRMQVDGERKQKKQIEAQLEQVARSQKTDLFPERQKGEMGRKGKGKKGKQEESRFVDQWQESISTCK